jgi:predicted amidohydrolase
VRAAAIQFASRLGDKTYNLERLFALCEQAISAGCQLLVLPELGTTGYGLGPRDKLRFYVEPIPGPTTERFAALTARHNCYIVVGLPEVEPATGQYFNTAALIGPQGLLGVMRKVHPDGQDCYRVSAGNLGFPVWDTPLGRIAIQICMDACYPESSRLAALQGAEIICLPTAWFGEAAPAGDWFTRAFENGVYFIAADHWGTQSGIAFSGGSAILGPDGQVLASLASGDGLAIADLELPADQRHQRLALRQPGRYPELIHSRLTWTYRFTRQTVAGAVFGAAAIQTGPIPPTVSAARQQVEVQIRQAAQAGAKLVVLPELSFEANPASAAAQAEPIGGPTTQWAEALSRELDLGLVLGLAERDGPCDYNSAVLVVAGETVAVYRKQHLGERDRAWATPGQDNWDTVATRFGTLGMMLGEEAWLPEPARCLALNDADIICAPSAVSAPWPVLVPSAETLSAEPTWHLWRARASENNTYILFANRSDAGCFGLSGIFGPDAYQRPRHEALVETPGPGLAALSLDTRDYLAPHTPNPARAKDRLRMRAVHLCAPLIQPSSSAPP